MNFFDPQCQEPPLNHTQFGLCDDENGKKAYTNTDDPVSWIATVKNDRGEVIVFTAIDKCVIKDGELLGEGRCDCMLTYQDNIVFVELKNKGKKWKEEGVAQVESTLKHFTSWHDIEVFKYKRAFVANTRHPNFQTIDNSTRRRIFDRYKVRINAWAEIEIK